MSDPADTPIPYRVVYSERVQSALRQFAARAETAGQGQAFGEALKELDRLATSIRNLANPWVDLTHESGQIWTGTVPPLVVRYAIYEERRLVIVASLPMLLPQAGF